MAAKPLECGVVQRSNKNRLTVNVVSRTFVRMPDRQDLLSTKQVAEMLGVTVSRVNQLVREGRLEPFVQGPGRTGARFFDRWDVARAAGWAP